MADRPHRPILHRLFSLTDVVGRTPAPILLAIIVALSASAGWVWVNRTGDMTWGSIIGIGLGVFIAGDWLMLALLPRRQRSFGPAGMALLALALLRWALTYATALIPHLPAGTWALVAIGNLALTGNVLDSLWGEPFRLGVTRVELKSPKLNGCPPLRVLHLSDLHIERLTQRERQMMAHVDELRPDLILITGDFLSTSYTHETRAQAECRQLLDGLRAPLGVYAVSGSPVVDPSEVVDQVLAGSHVRRLKNECIPIEVSGDDEPPVTLIGLSCTHRQHTDTQALAQTLNRVPHNPHTPFTILMYHSPDLIREAAQAGIDLYLCGHTHGGQIRFPFIGALFTASRYWKRYEMGRYVEEKTTLYVSRGIGMEGCGAPRARFLCPPEMILFELRGEE